MASEKKKKNLLIKSGVIRSRNDHRDYFAEGIFHEQRLAGAPLTPPASRRTNGNFANVGFGNKETLPSKLFLFDDQDSLKVGGNNVYNQGATFKCVAYAGCTIREKQVHDELMGALTSSTSPQTPPKIGDDDNNILSNAFPSFNLSSSSSSLEGARGGVSAPAITFSKDYLYDQRENSFGDGMSGSDLMQILTTHGCIEEYEHDHYLTLYNKIADLERRRRNSSSQTSSSSSNDEGAGAATDEVDKEIHGLQDEMNALIYKMKLDPLKRGTNDVYAKVTTAQGLKESLFHNGPCLIILPFYGNPHSTTFWLPPDENSVDEMGHAVTVMGYNDEEESFYIRNTWGSGWNITGHFWFPYSHFKLAWETWTIFPRGTDRLVYHKKRTGAAINSVNNVNSGLDSSNHYTSLLNGSAHSSLAGQGQGQQLASTTDCRHDEEKKKKKKNDDNRKFIEKFEKLKKLKKKLEKKPRKKEEEKSEEQEYQRPRKTSKTIVLLAKDAKSAKKK